MKLKTWLRQVKMQQQDFAKKVPLNEQHLSRLVTGKVNPSMKTARRIEELTEGAVTPNDWTKDKT